MKSAVNGMAQTVRNMMNQRFDAQCGKKMRAAMDIRRANAQQTPERTSHGWRLSVAGLLTALFLCLSSTAWAADMVTNGAFNLSTGWTLGGTGMSYSTAQNHVGTAGTGSLLETISGKNKSATGTSVQSVTITAGGVINAKTDIVAWAMESWTGAAGATRTITIDLRYSDATTVNIFSGTVAANSAWTNITNATATVFPLTLAKNVNQITVSVTTSTGNNATAVSSLYTDDISITYTPAVIDSLTVTSNTPVATTAIPGTANIQMQRLQLNSDAAGNGSCVLTSATVDDVNIAAIGTIANLKVHIDADTNFTNGVLGTATVAAWNGQSVVVDLTAIAAASRTVTSGTPKYLWITYDIDPLAVNGTTVQSRVTAIGVAAPDNPPIINLGTADSNSVLITSGLGCGGCHPLPVLDGAARDGVTGAVVGNHATHGTTYTYTCNTCHIEGSQVTGGTYTSRHRRGTIEMNVSGIGGVANARYDKNADHIADTVWSQTPAPVAWGKCENTACHGGVNSVTSYGGPTGAGPTWGGAASADKCTFCHNSNKTNAGGSANAYPTAASPFRGANAAGAHLTHLTLTSNLMNGGAVACADCHTVPATVGAAGHVDTNITAPADLTFGARAKLNTTTTAYDSVTLSCTVYCHGAKTPGLDPGALDSTPAWTVNWTTYVPGTAGTCSNYCHGLPPSDTTHNTQTFPATCKNCHGSTVTTTTDPPTIVASFHINGTVEATGCATDTCHGSTATGQIWPNTAGADNGATTPDIVGAHQLHMQWLASKVYAQTVDQLLADAASSTKQQTLCQYCHAIGDSDHMGATVADVFKTTTLTAAAPKVFWGGADETGTLGTFETTGNTCSNVDCHVQYGTAAAGSEPVATPDWYIAPTHTVLTSALPTTMNCAACHNNPSSDTAAKHTNHLNATATFGLTITCARCHDATTAWGTPTGTLPATGHLDGTFAVGGSVTQTYAGAFRTSFGGCGTSACHNNGANAAPPAYTWGTAITNCTECHGTATTLATNAHNEHLNNGYTTVACTDCHTAATATTHINATVNVDAAKATYNGTVVVGDVGYGTCLTASCHNLNTKVDTSAAWNVVGDLACDDCHYYAAAPTAAGNTAHARPLSTSHGDHFTAGKVCTQCHGALPTTTAHIGAKTTLADGAVALQDESTLAWTDASAVTDYTFDDTGNTCYSALNNGLGCHATAGAAGAADPTRPDWDVAFDGTNGATGCIACHTNTTTTAVNPNSGLHSVVPTVTGQQHNQSVNATTGCKACHNTMPVAGTHKNGTFTGDTVANLYLQFYSQTVANSGSGTCSGTGTSCHGDAVAANNYRDDWAHKWSSTANYYTTNTTACGGCHGDWNQTWNTGTIHRTSSGTQGNHGDGGTTWQCKECHVLEDSNNAYTFAWSTNDWGGTSKHGNNQIEVNTSAVYNATTGLCNSTCHNTADGVHNFADTSWAIVNLAGSAAPAGTGHAAGSNCKGCHATAQGTKRAIQGEFDGTTKHGPDANTWATMTNADCEACHDETTGPNGVVNIKVVGGTTINITWAASYTQATLQSMNSHCLSCHDGAGTNIGGVAPTTRDNISTLWAATTYNSHSQTGVVVPVKAKARSAHAAPTANVLKDETARTGYTTAVACLECHPAHGSSTLSPSSTKGNLAVVGNMVKTGYAEPGTCWTCHDAAGVKDYMGDSTTAGTHWSGTKKSAFAYKQRAFLSTHEVNGAGTGFICSVCHNPHGSNTGAQYNTPMLRGTWMTSPYPEDRTGKMNGTALAGAYATKSTADNGPRHISAAAYNTPANWGHGYGAAGGTGHDGYYIDDNTFGSNNTSYAATPAAVTHITPADSSVFGGLCASCHTSGTYAGGTVAAMKTYLDTTTFATGWGASVHNAVKGWSDGSTDCVNATNSPKMHLLNSTYTNGIRYIRDTAYFSPRSSYDWGSHQNAGNQAGYHAFPCSKCHTPHANSLPKLMVTNCLDVGTSTTSRKAHGTEPAFTQTTYSVFTGGGNANVQETAMHCHNRGKLNTNTGGGWNKVTGW